MIFNKNRELVSKIEESKQKISEIKNENISLNAEIVQLKNENETIKRENEKLKAEIGNLKDENSAVKKARDRLTSENSSLKNNEQSLKNRIEGFSLRIDSVLSEKAEILAEAREFAAEIIEKAEQKAEKITDDATSLKNVLEADALAKYNAELSRLNDFVVRWQANLPEPKERTVNSRKRAALTLILSEILSDRKPPESIEKGIEILDKLNAAIGGKSQDSENGFDLDEVLNPSEDLDLETLCKELGVME